MATPMSHNLGRLSKRSRAADAAQGKTMQSDDARVKRRRTSHSKNQAREEVNVSITAQKDSNMVSDPQKLAASSDTIHKGDIPLGSWSSFSVAAGQYSNLDPIFTPDDEYILLGLETTVHVYSLATSRLLRALQLHDGDRIVGFKLSPEDPKCLYIIASSGSVSKWDWLSGEQCSYWDACYRTVSVDVCLDDSEADSLFFLREHNDGKRQIVVRHLNDAELQDNTILETNVQINHLRVACKGQFVIAHGDQHVFFGRTSIGQSSRPLQYTWREMNHSVSVVCVDVRPHTISHRPGVQSPKDQRSLGKIDIGFGALDGSILVYHDILRFFDDDDGRQGGKNVTPRRLHWHRSSVNSVRWSRDGNYIISGGNESVMVLWQLDTGRKQFLPHLSSPIGNIVVSTSGNSYAVKLADNSITVLSARELQPSSTITGLQLCPKEKNLLQNTSEKTGVSPDTIAAALHPQNPDHLLITVPASRQLTQDGQPLATASVLQTYDIRTNRHVSRQALARTNATTLKVGPEGSHIVTPDVSHLCVSKDGKWMATVDNWSPYSKDLQALYRDETGFHRELEGSEDIFLKFWRWSSSSSVWELVTRIDSPHFTNNGPSRVLRLAVREHSHEFATIGSDSVLRFWCASIRQRSGLKPHDSAQPVETWKCRNTIDLKSYLNVDVVDRLSAASMAFSPDGSVLAVCLGSTPRTNAGLAILINAQTCSIHYSRVGLYVGLPCAAAFMGSRLVIASTESLSIWDTVDDLVRTIGLSVPGSASAKQPRLLAVNSETQSLAVSAQYPASQHSLDNRHTSTPSIQVYDIATLSLLSETILARPPVALLSTLHSSDYVVVDSGANVQRLGRLGKNLQSNHSPDLISHLNMGLANLFGRQGTRHKDSERTAVELSLATPGLRGELASVFGDAPPSVMAPANMIFRHVVDALSA
ncbi:WD40 repeat-like protein [Aspergillus heteromorphus CBS 117.55]|uniref:WD40 repeat-like protein n=1 Tax=Aspergillus heteromorphus CBS 117.55 TaxID=1448321 RepID=A0A317UYZ4_9EURO|nr:WD40 repeat-like protein [Aspergillus heteromorphus CBS 117.55]PWY66856.1 WD40 repeat-like protein [Aspergillus heteromorphus CBS 117.55]